MIYLANASSPRVREVMRAGGIGMLSTPAEGRSPDDYKWWAADNGCFGKGYPGEARWLQWLERHSAHVDRCLFATAPDVVGDAAATLQRSEPWYSEIRARGYPAALVGQDGLEDELIPWDEIDAFFIGGSTEWKLSAAAAELANQAIAHGKWVHMGRVNSRKRWKYAESIGCHSADGTFLAFGPDQNLIRMQAWML